MGDVHVHTAPHAYEKNGYSLWAWGDSGMSAVYFGLACAEAGVAAYMLKRRATLPWRESGGGSNWWSRKFIFLVSMVPLTLLRAWNLHVWGAFNREAGEGVEDFQEINSLKDQGDWMNAVVYWYMLAVKALFLIVWIECNRSVGYIRWRNVYIQLLAALALLFGALGIPQYFAVHYGRICQNFRQNDYCRKYHDITASLAFLQAAMGLLCGVGFGVSAWHWRIGDSEYEALPQSSLRNHARNSRDSYGSTEQDHAAGGGSGSDPSFLCKDAHRYAGVAYIFFLSLIAQSAFNIYFAWYAVGGIGLLSNSTLLFVTVVKMCVVELMPLAWASVIIYADVATAERMVADEPLESMCGPPGGGRTSSSESGAAGAAGAAGAHQRYEQEDTDEPPPAGAYQIE